jgi:hypothetical protein
MIQEEGSSDESDQGSDVNNEDNVEVKGNFCGSEQKLYAEAIVTPLTRKR